MSEHLPECRCALWPSQREIHPDEHEKIAPDEIGVSMCADGCPVLARELEWARASWDRLVAEGKVQP